MKFPYYKQEREYSCGAAAMRMVLENLGIKKSENEIIKYLGTNKTKGTMNKDFPRLAEKFKLNYFVKKNSSISDLKSLIRNGYNIIICYFYPAEKIGHYSVIRKIDSNFIYFYDPLFGPKHKYSLHYFNKIWKNNPRYEKVKRWMLGVKR